MDKYTGGGENRRKEGILKEPEGPACAVCLPGGSCENVGHEVMRASGLVKKPGAWRTAPRHAVSMMPRVMAPPGSGLLRQVPLTGLAQTKEKKAI
jgi:hypothetical protein